MVNCAFCDKDCPEEYAYTCKSCYFPFHDGCFQLHYEVGYHEDYTWINDHIFRPTLGTHSYQYDGSHTWIPAQEPVEFGNWRPT